MTVPDRCRRCRLECRRCRLCRGAEVPTVRTAPEPLPEPAVPADETHPAADSASGASAATALPALPGADSAAGVGADEPAEAPPDRVADRPRADEAAAVGAGDGSDAPTSRRRRPAAGSTRCSRTSPSGWRSPGSLSSGVCRSARPLLRTSRPHRRSTSPCATRSPGGGWRSRATDRRTPLCPLFASATGCGSSGSGGSAGSTCGSGRPTSSGTRPARWPGCSGRPEPERRRV